MSGTRPASTPTTRKRDGRQNVDEAVADADGNLAEGVGDGEACTDSTTESTPQSPMQ